MHRLQQQLLVLDELAKHVAALAPVPRAVLTVQVRRADRRASRRVAAIVRPRLRRRMLFLAVVAVTPVALTPSRVDRQVVHLDVLEFVAVDDHGRSYGDNTNNNKSLLQTRSP